MYDLVLGRTSFLGNTGYANHARGFFSSLNELIKVGIETTTTGATDELTAEQREMLTRRAGNSTLNIILETTDNSVFYTDIPSPKIAYNVWESTEQPCRFFSRLLEYDQLWLPSEWQKQCTIKQGYPEDKVVVIPEGVDTTIYKPGSKSTEVFRFVVIGKWEYRKSTTEIIQSFLGEFIDEPNVELVICVDNDYPVDSLTSTEDRLDFHGFHDKRIKVVHYLTKEDYVRLLQSSDVFVSCSRAEGWNLPLIEAIACGTASICSNYGGQLEYAADLTSVFKVNIKDMCSPKGTYPVGSVFPGLWAEPDFRHLREGMRFLYNNSRSVEYQRKITDSVIEIGERFSWTQAAKKAYSTIQRLSGDIETQKQIEYRLRNESRIKWFGNETEMVAHNTTAGLFALCDDYVNKSTSMVEVGSFGGVSTEVFASRAGEVYAVDEWTNCYGDTSNIQKAQARFDLLLYRTNNVKKLRSNSVLAADMFNDGSLDLVYIDAAHDFDSVCGDIRVWLPKIKPDGVICGHDYFEHNEDPGADGTRPAIDKMLGKYCIKHYCDTSWAVELCERRLKVITYANENRETLERLRESTTKHGIELEILGMNSKWVDFYTKFYHVREYVKALPKRQLVLYIDAYDTYVLGDAEEIIDKYIGYINKNKGAYISVSPYSYIIIGAEKNLYPDDSLRSRYPKGNEVYRYVNSGTYISPAGLLYEALDDILENYTTILGAEIDYNGVFGRNDQWLLTKYFLANGHKAIRDTTCTLFQTLNQVNADELTIEDDRVVNNTFETKPTVLHGNGAGKVVLDELINKLTHKDTNTKCAFVATWLGKLPENFELFCQSCEANPMFDWFVFTDQSKPAGCPHNVKFVYQSKLDFEVRVKKTIGIPIIIGLPYKLCDYKPLYGHLYSEYLTNYSYWGFCDLDVIFGDVYKFFGKYIENNYEVITLGGSTKDGLHYRIAGPCTLVKNTQKMCELYKHVPKFNWMLTQCNMHTNFDEVSWSDFVLDGKYKVHIGLGWQNFQNDTPINSATWTEGKLILDSGKEIVLFHIREDSDIIALPTGFRLSANKTRTFITGGDVRHLELTRVCVESLLKFSNARIVVYGFGCDVNFTYPGVENRRVEFVPEVLLSDGRAIDAYFCKQQCCLDALKYADSDLYVWIDSDGFGTENVDKIWLSADKLTTYPLVMSHIYDQVVVTQDGKPQDGFNKLWHRFGSVDRSTYPWVMGCMLLFNANCRQFFTDVLELKNQLSSDELRNDLSILGDEALMNLVLWKYKATEQLGVHVFDIYYRQFFVKFFSASWLDSYKEYMSPNNGSLSKHIQLPSKDDVWMLHCQHDPAVLRDMYNEYCMRLGIDDTKYYLPHRTDLVDVVNTQVDTFSYTYKEIFEYKSYEYGNCKVNSGDVVIDCGANVGMFTRYAMKCGASQVYSFEPEPSNFAALVKNVPTWKAQKAISDHVGKSELYLHSCEGGHSLKDNNINHTQLGKKTEVETTTLDHIFQELNLDHVDYLKVDVEGAELDIFTGLSDDNLAKIDKICIEYHNMILGFNSSLRDDLLRRFNSTGFLAHVLYLDKIDHLQMIYLWRQEQVEVGDDVEVSVHFVNGPICEILGNNSHEYDVDFIDVATNRSMYNTVLRANTWARPDRKYYTDWLVNVKDITTKTHLITHKFNPTDRRVLISFDSKSLGDTIAWFPYVEEYRVRNKCHVIVSTWWNTLFDSVYPELEFVPIGTEVRDLYATYNLGVFDNDLNKNKHKWNTVPLQRVSSDILGVEYSEKKPRIVELFPKDMPTWKFVPLDYVCISEHATLQAKYWNYLGGWQEVVNHIRSKGLDVLTVSKEGSKLDNVKVMPSFPILTIAHILSKAKMFIGVGSGLSWLSWAVGTHVILISGFSKPFCEFTTDCTRIINEDVCHGCFNDPELVFDRSNWMWCPRGKDFECTKSIEPKVVIEAVDKLLC